MIQRRIVRTQRNTLKKRLFRTGKVSAFPLKQFAERQVSFAKLIVYGQRRLNRSPRAPQGGRYRQRTPDRAHKANFSERDVCQREVRIVFDGFLEQERGLCQLLRNKCLHLRAPFEVVVESLEVIGRHFGWPIEFLRRKLGLQRLGYRRGDFALDFEDARSAQRAVEASSPQKFARRCLD